MEGQRRRIALMMNLNKPYLIKAEAQLRRWRHWGHHHGRRHRGHHGHRNRHRHHLCHHRAIITPVTSVTFFTLFTFFTHHGNVFDLAHTLPLRLDTTLLGLLLIGLLRLADADSHVKYKKLNVASIRFQKSASAI